MARHFRVRKYAEGTFWIDREARSGNDGVGYVPIAKVASEADGDALVRIMNYLVDKFEEEKKHWITQIIETINGL